MCACWLWCICKPKRQHEKTHHIGKKKHCEKCNHMFHSQKFVRGWQKWIISFYISGQISMTKRRKKTNLNVECKWILKIFTYSNGEFYFWLKCPNCQPSYMVSLFSSELRDFVWFTSGLDLYESGSVCLYRSGGKKIWMNLKSKYHTEINIKNYK